MYSAKPWSTKYYTSIAGVVYFNPKIQTSLFICLIFNPEKYDILFQIISTKKILILNKSKTCHSFHVYIIVVKRKKTGKI